MRELQIEVVTESLVAGLRPVYIGVVVLPSEAVDHERTPSVHKIGWST